MNRELPGMVGGLGPESTVIYYQQIIAAYRKAKQHASYPHLLLSSIDLQRMLVLLAASDLAGIADYMLHAIRSLAAAGATFAFIGANTWHIVFDQVEQLSPIPLISIVQTACAAAKQAGCKRLGLFGTRYTMQADFYPKVFAPSGLAIVPPAQSEQDYIHEKYMGELLNGVVVPETRQQLLKIMQGMQDRDQIDGVILGGTELSLLFQDHTAGSIPLFDTTKIHVQAVVARMLE